MKAHTAAILLRSARKRFEEWGVLQLGQMEAIALEFASKHTQDQPTFVCLKELQANGVMGINRITKDMWQALRAGYKALEALPPDTTFTIAAGGQEHEPKPPKANEAEWWKGLGLNEKDIKDSLDDTDEDK